MPARKLIAATITSLAALGTMWATTGSWDQEETVAAIGVASAFAIGWITPKSETNPAG